MLQEHLAYDSYPDQEHIKCVPDKAVLAASLACVVELTMSQFVQVPGCAPQTCQVAPQHDAHSQRAMMQGVFNFSWHVIVP